MDEPTSLMDALIAGLKELASAEPITWASGYSEDGKPIWFTTPAAVDFWREQLPGFDVRSIEPMPGRKS